MRSISQTFRCFDEVARRGSIRKAAESLHLTAAAVHQQIRNLEEQVGAALFDRLPRGMQLTTAGEIVIAAVRRGQRDFDNALTQVEDLAALRRGHVNLAVSPSSAEQLVPNAIGAAARQYPGITYSVRSGNGESILRAVETGEADIGYALRRRPPPGVVEVLAFAQQLGVVTLPGHPLTSLGRKVRLRDCLDYPLVLMTPDTDLRAMVERIDARQQRTIRPLVETSSVPMVRRLVSDGIGVGLLIAENVDDEVARGTLAWTPLADAGARSFSCVYQRADMSPTSAMTMFTRFFTDAIETMNGRFSARPRKKATRARNR
jgi:DNA-binding transcriptional LysR family regulator